MSVFLEHSEANSHIQFTSISFYYASLFVPRHIKYCGWYIRNIKQSLPFKGINLVNGNHSKISSPSNFTWAAAHSMLDLRWRGSGQCYAFAYVCVSLCDSFLCGFSNAIYSTFQNLKFSFTNLHYWLRKRHAHKEQKD